MESERIFSLYKFISRRREMRRPLTPQEKILWEHLRNRKLGMKFRRQHSIGPYIADFYSRESMLVVEIDGNQHKDKNAKIYDSDRTSYFNELGIKVLRFWNGEVETDIEKMLAKIKKATNPSPLGGEGQG
ncbi:MAG: endonuclease domain-containing protein [Patescibacteria group bacterium]